MRSPEELAGQRLWFGIPGPRLTDDTRRHLHATRPGGIILFRRNIDSAKQVSNLTRELRRLLGDKLHIAVDQEGGKVARFDTDVTIFPGNMALGAIARNDLETGLALAQEQGWVVASELREMGLDVNLAPCVDLATASENSVVGTRSFGSDPDLVSKLACALAKGQRAGGVLSAWKHYPGLGSARIDPHHRIAHITMSEAHSQPFARAHETDLIMTTHALDPALNTDTPVTLSAKSMAPLRSSFRGAIITDDLEMGALNSWPMDELAMKAVRAGHDIALVCHTAENQQRAFDTLRQGFAKQAEWLRDVESAATRLDRLCAPEPKSRNINSSENNLSEKVAQRAVTLLRGRPPRFDPTAAKPLLLLLEPDTTSPAEDPLRGESLLILRESLRGHTNCETLEFPLFSAREESLRQRASGHESLFVTLCGARFSRHQRQLIQLLLNQPSPVVFLLLAEPFDINVIPYRESDTVLCTYSSRPPAQRALARVLLGQELATGTCPVDV